MSHGSIKQNRARKHLKFQSTTTNNLKTLIKDIEGT